MQCTGGLGCLAELCQIWLRVFDGKIKFPQIPQEETWASTFYSPATKEMMWTSMADILAVYAQDEELSNPTGLS